MSDLQKLLYRHILETQLEAHLDRCKCMRLDRQIEREEEKLESLIPATYKQLLREYGEHISERAGLDIDAMYLATLALVRDFPG